MKRDFDIPFLNRTSEMSVKELTMIIVVLLVVIAFIVLIATVIRDTNTIPGASGIGWNTWTLV